jgi:hypothetical protein
VHLLLRGISTLWGTQKVSTASTAVTIIGEKPCKTAHFQAVDLRVVFDVAVGIHPMAVDNSWQYRPHESPAKRYITCGAVDAGDTLRELFPSAVH